MGRAAVNVGDVTGAELYSLMLEQLNHICPGGGKSACWWRSGKHQTHHVRDAKINGAWVVNCKFGRSRCSERNMLIRVPAEFSYTVAASWISDDEHTLLVHTMADTLRKSITLISPTYNALT
jgi:hypothetical protein